jgi:ribosomal protein S18 acetylase RimI-like enzyme
MIDWSQCPDVESVADPLAGNDDDAGEVVPAFTSTDGSGAASTTAALKGEVRTWGAQVMVRRATRKDVERLIPLFCSGAKDIGLSEDTCLPENHERLRKLMMDKCARGLVWVLSERKQLSGMIVLGQFDARIEIAYVVVAEALRGQRRVGPALVRHVQSLPHVTWLWVEARNQRSLKLFESSGFRRTADEDREYPALVWDRPDASV